MPPSRPLATSPPSTTRTRSQRSDATLEGDLDDELDSDAALDGDLYGALNGDFNDDLWSDPEVKGNPEQV